MVDQSRTSVDAGERRGVGMANRTPVHTSLHSGATTRSDKSEGRRTYRVHTPNLKKFKH